VRLFCYNELLLPITILQGLQDACVLKHGRWTQEGAKQLPLPALHHTCPTIA
jgi:hypothetical protein